MELLNPGMIISLSAVLVPVIIHFFIRSKIKSVPFPSIFFLKETLRKKNAKIRFSQILLMLVRIFIILFLSFAFMKPVFINESNSSLMDLSVSRNYYLIFDTSFSMKNSSDEITCFEHMKQKLMMFLGKIDSNDLLTVFTTDNNGTILGKPFQAISKDVINKLKNDLVPGNEKSDILSVFKNIEDYIKVSGDKKYSIIIFSDFQLTSSQSFINYINTKSNINNILLVFPDSRFNKNINNIFIKEIKQPFRTFLNNADTVMDVSISANAEHAMAGSVEHNINSNILQTNPVNNVSVNEDDKYQNSNNENLLNSGTLDSFNFKISNEEIIKESLIVPKNTDSLFFLTSSITGDNFSEDNVFYSLINNERNIRVVIRSLSGGKINKYIKYALDPFIINQLKFKTPFIFEEVQDMSKIQLDPDNDIFIVSDLSELKTEELAAIEEFVINKGSGIIAFDELNSPELYNKTLFSKGSTSNTILPSMIEAIEEIDNTKNNKYKINSDGFPNSDILSKNVFWNSIQIRRVIKLKNTDAERKSYENFSSLNNHPLIMFNKIGNGLVCCFLTSLTPENTTLVSEPVFVPLMHKIIEILRLGKEKKNYIFAGEKYYLKMNTGEPKVINSANQKVELLKDFDGKYYFVPVKNGVFSISYKAEKKSNEIVCVNINPDESDMAYIDINDIRKENKLSTASAVNEMDSFLNLNDRYFALYRFFIIIVLLLMLAEIMIIAKLRP